MHYYKNLRIPFRVDNPTDEARHEMLKYMLKKEKRALDINNITNILSPPRDINTICPSGRGKDVKVAVIGAGEAGLAAAYELRKIGCNITLFEASDRIGGRIYTHYFDKSKKYYGELGAMRVPVSHETTWHYINLFKLKTSIFVNNDENNIFYIKGNRAYNDMKRKGVFKSIYPAFNLKYSERYKPWPNLQQRVCNKYLNSLSPDLRREIIEIKPNYSKAIEELDKLSYLAAYESVGLSNAAISMLSYLDGSTQYLGLSLTEILHEYYTLDFDFTYRIAEGMINLPNSLYDALCDRNEYGYSGLDKDKLGQIKIKMNTPIEGIYEMPFEKGISLKYMESSTAEKVQEKFDYIICAIPFTSLRKLEVEPSFTEIKTKAIKEMNYHNAQKLFLFLKDRFWERGRKSKRILGGCSLTDLPLTSIYYPSDHAKPIRNQNGKWGMKFGVSPEEAGVLLACYNWSQEAIGINDEYRKLELQEVMNYIEEVHSLPKHYLNDKLLGSKSLIWSDMEYILAGGVLSKPSDKISFSYAVTLPEMNNRVFFAGEHISQKHVWQQGALQTGMIAANEIAKRIEH